MTAHNFPCRAPKGNGPEAPVVEPALPAIGGRVEGDGGGTGIQGIGTRSASSVNQLAT